MKGIRGQRSGFRDRRTAVLSSLSTIHYPLSTASARRGISLMEVLISIFILSIGLLGVAAMIPIGKLAMIETAKSDRTGACGRAALREVKVRRMMNSASWSPVPTTNPFVIDPLGYATIGQTGGLTARFGGGTVGPQRITLSYLTTSHLINSIFRWRDDLIYSLPKDMTPGTTTTTSTPLNGERPMGWFASDESYASVSLSTVTSYPASEGNYSWFLTVSPQLLSDGSYAGTFSVAAVVCYKRVLAATSEVTYSGVSTMATPPTYGGVGIKFTKGATMPKVNEWVLLNGAQCTWYRVVSVGVQSDNTAYAMLVGPDWYGNSSNLQMIVLPGVTGVYTTTVQLDNDAIWTR